jgi:antitoxin component YwqK of YwqJK toxin-antitoxin module
VKYKKTRSYFRTCTFIIFLFTSCVHTKKTNTPSEALDPCFEKKEDWKVSKTLYPSGVVSSCILTSADGKPGQYHIDFYENGIKKREGHHGHVSNKDISTGMDIGTWYEYDEQGRLTTETTYNNDVFEKATIDIIRYYPNAKIKSVEKYNNHALYQTEMKKLGEWKFFDEHGKLIKTENYQPLPIKKPE